MKNEVLHDFQSYLRSNSLVQAKYIPFYAHWARGFLDFSKTCTNLSYDLKIQKFIDFLKAQKNIADWQIKQAENAVTLYVNQFLDRNELPSSKSQNTKTVSVDSHSMEEMRQALRIKHYAYRTELKYIDWVKDFYSYMKNMKKKDVDGGLESSDVRDYLSHLALKKRVAASTQNQAFNALIFLFRNVLKIDLRDLNKAVRAKRGQKLPVVFTVEEVKEILKCIEGENLLILLASFQKFLYRNLRKASDSI